MELFNILENIDSKIMILKKEEFNRIKNNKNCSPEQFKILISQLLGKFNRKR